MGRDIGRAAITIGIYNFTSAGWLTISDGNFRMADSQTKSF
jgi:hypothetical protein